MSVGHTGKLCQNGLNLVDYRDSVGWIDRNHSLDGGAYWRHLKNRMERSDAAAAMRAVATVTVTTFYCVLLSLSFVFRLLHFFVNAAICGISVHANKIDYTFAPPSMKISKQVSCLY